MDKKKLDNKSYILIARNKFRTALKKDSLNKHYLLKTKYDPR